MLETIQWVGSLFIILIVIIYSLLEIRKYNKQKRIIDEFRNI